MTQTKTFKAPDKWAMEAKKPSVDVQNTFVCDKCGFSFQTWHPVTWFNCPECAPKTPDVQVVVPMHMRAEAEQGNAKQKAFMEKPETKEKLMNGEWRVEKNDY